MSKKKGPEPITVTTIRNLNDKLYDKRKLGAVEVEVQVRDLHRSGNGHDKIIEILTFLQESFISSSSVSSRKGGLIGIAAAALGLGQDVGKYLEQLVPPVLQCFLDPDNKVRYYACESLYNITKVCRGGILPHFNGIFDDLCKLAADPDPNVRSAAELLDNLIKEIVTEGNPFDVPKFIPLLSKRIYVTNPECRKFLVSWLMVLDAVPDMDLVQYLPHFLDGLFKMLNDPNDEMRSTVVTALFELLKEIRHKPTKVDFGALVPILIPQANIADQYNFITSLTAMSWLSDVISIGKQAILPFVGDLLTGILPCISHSSQGVEDIAKKANDGLLELVKQTTEDINVKSILTAVQNQFSNQRVPTRLAALGWVLTLHARSTSELMDLLHDLFPVLIKMLSDPAEEVVRFDLKVLATLAANETYFNTLIDSLLSLFRKDRKLLEHRGNLIVRQLALNISAEKIFRALSKNLENETDPEFGSTVIQILNLILLTATELHEVRGKLKKLSDGHEDLFICLYQSWCHNPASVLSLCLLSQVYKHSSNLIYKFADLEITVNFLVEIDKLVQLLESPIFMFLRLQLLEADQYPHLFKTLFGLLMLLPQSTAFETLKNRLGTVTSLGVMHVMPKEAEKKNNEKKEAINFEELLEHFVKLQNRHADSIRAKRLAAEKTVAPTQRTQ